MAARRNGICAPRGETRRCMHRRHAAPGRVVDVSDARPAGLAWRGLRSPSGDAACSRLTWRGRSAAGRQSAASRPRGRDRGGCWCHRQRTGGLTATRPGVHAPRHSSCASATPVLLAATAPRRCVAGTPSRPRWRPTSNRPRHRIAAPGRRRRARRPSRHRHSGQRLACARAGHGCGSRPTARRSRRMRSASTGAAMSTWSRSP
jgi:hypothetical protein